MDVAVGLSPAVVFAVEPVIIQAILTLSLQLNLSAKELKARRPDRKLGGEKIQSAVCGVVEVMEAQEGVTALPLEVQRLLQSSLGHQACAKTGMT